MATPLQLEELRAKRLARQLLISWKPSRAWQLRRQSAATRATTLVMVVKSVPLKNSEDGEGPYSTEKERVACAPTLTSAWTELVLCDVTSVAAAPTSMPGHVVGAAATEGT